MPLNENRLSRSRRDRWPLQFDLEGVPHDTQMRNKMLSDMRGEPNYMENHMNVPKVQNSFASDNEPFMNSLTVAQKQQLLKELMAEQNKGGQQIDLSNPPVAPYVFREFPKCMYAPDGKGARTAHNAQQEKELAKAGYVTKPIVKEEALIG